MSPTTPTTDPTTTVTVTTTNSDAGTGGVETLAYAQWVVIHINNIGTIPIKLTNLSLSWGKLYIDNDKNKEVDASRYNNRIIGPNDSLEISSCGRENASSGTEGSFDLVDPSASDKRIRHFYWSCPWGSSTNEWTVSGSNSREREREG